MSYDFSIGDVDLNYTWNGSALYYDHMPETEGLRSLSGLTGAEATEVLQPAWDAIHRTWMKDWKPDEVGSPTFCARYDTPNGWGSTVGALIFLARITAACAANPDKQVRVSA